jgi:Flp pilus assembly protein TadB
MDRLMDSLALLVRLAVPIGLASVLMEMWREFRDSKRSIATAIASTCIVANIPIVFVATCLETQPELCIGTFLQTVGFAGMFCAGISEGTGLVWDQRIARLQSCVTFG